MAKRVFCGHVHHRPATCLKMSYYRYYLGVLIAGARVMNLISECCVVNVLGIMCFFVVKFTSRISLFICFSILCGLSLWKVQVAYVKLKHTSLSLNRTTFRIGIEFRIFSQSMPLNPLSADRSDSHKPLPLILVTSEPLPGWLGIDLFQKWSKGESNQSSVVEVKQVNCFTTSLLHGVITLGP